MEERFPQAKLSLVTQTIPEDTEKYKDEEKAMGIGKKEESIRRDAEKADNVFSVGHRIHDHFTNTFRAIPKDKRPVHRLFLPEPSKTFQETTVEYVQGREKIVLFFSKVIDVGKLKGLDFTAKALARVAERSHERIQLRIRGVSKEEYRASMKILQASINSGKLIPTLLPHGTQEDICRDMHQAHLVLMPSRAEPFGLVGLEAMAAGVPVLISDQSGLAALVNEVVPEFHHSVLGITGDDSVDVRHWADQIEKVLQMSEAEFSRAAALKQKLLDSRYWEESHQCFLQACGGPGYDTQQPSPVQERKRDVDSTGETSASREALTLENPQGGHDQSPSLSTVDQTAALTAEIQQMELQDHLAITLMVDQHAPVRKSSARATPAQWVDGGLRELMNQRESMQIKKHRHQG
ncbi:Hypp8828 [Branchiostoma lanceolatum]|nr:Hypp8828 [Branchiostoma lanceolatum]